MNVYNCNAHVFPQISSNYKVILLYWIYEAVLGGWYIHDYLQTQVSEPIIQGAQWFFFREPEIVLNMKGPPPYCSNLHTPSLPLSHPMPQRSPLRDLCWDPLGDFLTPESHFSLFPFSPLMLISSNTTEKWLGSKSRKWHLERNLCCVNCHYPKSWIFLPF